MTEVVFTKDAGRFKKGRTVDFPPALADFFVSKVRCADFVNPQKASVAKKSVVLDDFSDILLDDKEMPSAKRRKPVRSRILTPRQHDNREYSRCDMRAED